MSTFTWTLDRGAMLEKKPRVKSSPFGDGYEQRQADGINTTKEVWTVTFSNRDISEIDDIEEFLAARGGTENFTWTPPRSGSAKKFVCRQWQRTIVTAAVDTITATFEQVFEA